MENKWYMYRNKNTGQEVKIVGEPSQVKHITLYHTGFTLINAIDITVSSKEKAAK